MRTIRLTYLPTNTDFTVGPVLDGTAETIIREVYQGCRHGVVECREHDDVPALKHLKDPADGRIHGASVYLQQRRHADGEIHWVACHHPNNPEELKFPDHSAPAGMTDEHKREVEYYQRACEAAGYATALEVPIPGSRLDITAVAAIGPVGLVGFEIQHSEISTRKVVARDRTADRSGIPLVWSADRRDPSWAFKVAHVETTRLPEIRPPRTWTVTTGPRKIHWASCTARNQAEFAFRCPTSRNSCGKLHPYFRPLEGLVVDDIAERVPAGDLVRLDTTPHRQGVVLVEPADLERWRNENPIAVSEQQSVAGVDRYGCTYASDRVERQVLEARRAANDLVAPAPICNRCCTAECEHLPGLGWHECFKNDGCEVRSSTNHPLTPQLRRRRPRREK